jgi:hypothetical protein
MNIEQARKLKRGNVVTLGPFAEGHGLTRHQTVTVANNVHQSGATYQLPNGTLYIWVSVRATHEIVVASHQLS